MSTSPHHPFPSKLDLAAAEEIRARHAYGEAPRGLAVAYGVAVSSIYDILRGRAHAPRLLVPVTSAVLARVDAGARAARSTREIFAAALIERGLASFDVR